jgi:hypothetical protein
MNQIRSLMIGIFVSGLLFIVPVVCFGQAATEPNYEVSVHLIMGSNDATAKPNLPASLSSISQQLKSRVAYTNFRLAGTIIGRMSNTGSYEYKSYSDLFGQDPKFRSFLDLTIAGLRNSAVERGAGSFQAQSLRFGARVPVIVSYGKDQSGKDQPVVNYEQIGLTVAKLGLLENVPTLVGTLDVPNGTDMIFLVITVKAV